MKWFPEVELAISDVAHPVFTDKTCHENFQDHCGKLSLSQNNVYCTSHPCSIPRDVRLSFNMLEKLLSEAINQNEIISSKADRTNLSTGTLIVTERAFCYKKKKKEKK